MEQLLCIIIMSSINYISHAAASYLGFRLHELQEEGPHVYDPVETGERYHMVDA
jgi:hypothetical protein